MTSCAISAFGQYNNIFIIDCSRSMICPNGEKTGNWKTEERDVRWNPAKDALKEWISSYEDNDMITLLLFNDKVVSTISKKKKDIEWNNIDTELDKAVKSHHGKTSICNAWLEAERYFDSNKNNFFYIITDGIDDHSGPCHLVDQIRAFCSKIPEGSHGYVLKLDHATFPQDVLDALNSSPCLTQLPVGPIPRFGGFISDEVYVTTSNMKSGGIDRTSPLGFDRKTKYNITAKPVNEKYFDIAVSNGSVNNGVLTFDVKLKDGINLNDLKHELGSDTYEISVELFSNDVKIVRNDHISIIVTLKAVSELQLLNDVSQIELGKATWYNEFIIPMSNPDTLSYTIKPQFNDEAIHNGSTATFVINGLPLPVRLFVNGKQKIDNKFTLSSNDSVLLQFVTDVPCEDFDIESSLSIFSTSNLDRVNGIDNPNEYSISIGGEVYEKWNPLKKLLFVLSVILLISFLIWILYNLIRPSMMGKLNIVDENNETIKGLGDLAGFHRVILYSGPNRNKSGLLDSLIFTKRKYIHIDGLPCAIKISGKSDKTLYIHPAKGIKINGSLLFSKLKLRARTIFLVSWDDNKYKIRIKYF